MKILLLSFILSFTYTSSIICQGMLIDRGQSATELNVSYSHNSVVDVYGLGLGIAVKREYQPSAALLYITQGHRSSFALAPAMSFFLDIDSKVNIGSTFTYIIGGGNLVDQRFSGTIDVFYNDNSKVRLNENRFVPSASVVFGNRNVIPVVLGLQSRFGHKNALTLGIFQSFPIYRRNRALYHSTFGVTLGVLVLED